MKKNDTIKNRANLLSKRDVAKILAAAQATLDEIGLDAGELIDDRDDAIEMILDADRIYYLGRLDSEEYDEDLVEYIVEKHFTL